MLVEGSELKLSQNWPPERLLEFEVRRWGYEVGPQRPPVSFYPICFGSASSTAEVREIPMPGLGRVEIEGWGDSGTSGVGARGEGRAQTVCVCRGQFLEASPWVVPLSSSGHTGYRASQALGLAGSGCGGVSKESGREGAV